VKSTELFDVLPLWQCQPGVGSSWVAGRRMTRIPPVSRWSLR